MLDREQLETFAVVIEQQSFEKAATALSITRGAVSQRIKALEESLSTVLVLRDRPISPTSAGEVLLRYVKALRVMEGSALQELTPQPKLHAPIPLSIAVNADSLATWFPAVLKELLLSHLVALEVVADDQDHTSQLLCRGEVIGCISTAPKAADGFIAERLGAMEYRCYATPEFASRAFPDGLTVPAVLAAPAVLFNRKDSLHDDFLKSRFGFSIDRYTKHFLPSPVALLEGVAMGAGYGLVPSSQARPLVESGQLVDLCPQHTVMVDLYWHHWELEPPLAHDVTALIVKVAHRELVSPVADESVLVLAEPSESMAGLRHTSTAMAGNTAKADCNTE
ncbi:MULTISPECIES: HTH-type transcriptional regulator ArgP [unclassified Hydrogenophaga]|jgi:LysR family transcriptional regulator (chromosome initiation inhibitor)|uniref:HTH-type transcriptional regulator ArgP n=1 Tax=unclassified Hydrogenophaga TaxID=2610897 RepID=UPI0009A37B72|nr:MULTISPECIES: HTH-type transcriptional regulator ArgP [unclassified Hydrogenophaga]MCV0437564.1 HTH-type transcriptional regulator ArgP [Hydrogenophaga sp.]